MFEKRIDRPEGYRVNIFVRLYHLDETEHFWHINNKMVELRRIQTTLRLEFEDLKLRI